MARHSFNLCDADQNFWKYDLGIMNNPRPCSCIRNCCNRLKKTLHVCEVVLFNMVVAVC